MEGFVPLEIGELIMACALTMKYRISVVAENIKLKKS
jgi:hypothetical protein